VTDQAGHPDRDRLELIPTSWSDRRLFFIEATCSVCGQIFSASGDGRGLQPGERERKIRAEFVEHAYAKHR